MEVFALDKETLVELNLALKNAHEHLLSDELNKYIQGISNLNSFKHVLKEMNVEFNDEEKLDEEEDKDKYKTKFVTLESPFTNVTLKIKNIESIGTIDKVNEGEKLYYIIINEDVTDKLLYSNKVIKYSTKQQRDYALNRLKKQLKNSQTIKFI